MLSGPPIGGLLSIISKSYVYVPNISNPPTIPFIVLFTPASWDSWSAITISSLSGPTWDGIIGSPDAGDIHAPLLYSVLSPYNSVYFAINCLKPQYNIPRVAALALALPASALFISSDEEFNLAVQYQF